MLFKELTCVFGCYRVNFTVNAHANAKLTLAHAEGSAELNLVLQIILCNEILQILNHLS